MLIAISERLIYKNLLNDNNPPFVFINWLKSVCDKPWPRYTVNGLKGDVHCIVWSEARRYSFSILSRFLSWALLPAIFSRQYVRNSLICSCSKSMVSNISFQYLYIHEGLIELVQILIFRPISRLDEADRDWILITILNDRNNNSAKFSRNHHKTLLFIDVPLCSAVPLLIFCL